MYCSRTKNGGQRMSIYNTKNYGFYANLPFKKENKPGSKYLSKILCLNKGEDIVSVLFIFLHKS